MNLYFRLLWLMLRMWRMPRRALLDPARVAFRVMPTDCDINLHMNNGRYLAFMDLGRVHLVRQSGLLAVMLGQRWQPVLSAAEIHFIRPLAPLQRFELVTRLVSWDERYFYLEQKFESRGMLCAHAYVKGVFLRGGSRVSNAAFAAAAGVSDSPPPMPRELRIWAELGDAKKQSADPKNI